MSVRHKEKKISENTIHISGSQEEEDKKEQHSLPLADPASLQLEEQDEVVKINEMRKSVEGHMPPQLKEIVEEPVEVHAPTGSSIAATLADGMEQIKAHGRFLWMNSREMKLVKARYEETIDLLNERLAADNYEDIRARLMVSLSALSEVCEAYKSAKIADPFTDNSPRHQGVLRILNASRQALHFFENCSEEQVLAQKEEGKPESLVDFMRRQKEPVTEDKKKEAEARDQAMKMGHAILVSNIELLDINSSRLSEIYYRYNNEIHQFIQNRLPVDEQVFKEKKDGLLEGYGNMISYLKDYITHAKPVYKDAIRRMNAARQVYSQLVREKNRLKLLDFSKLEKLGRAGTASWEAVILPGVARVTETEQNGRKQYDMDSGHKGYFYSETNNTEDINLLGNMAGAPTQIFRTYEPAVLKKSDGSLKKGYVYTNNTRDEFNLVSMTDIINNAQKNGVGISYTDEALRQLSCIQVMDVLCGKKKRSQKSLLYSARMTDIQGEQAIVISGVMSVENEGYFSEETYESLKNGASIKEEKKASGNDIVKQEFYSAIEDEEGKLRLAYYDADMADRILALDADTFFAEMQMKLSDEQKDAFRNRLHGLQEFFAKDKQSGIRKEVEDYENEKRKRLVRRVEKKINKLKNAKSDNSATFQEQARRKIEEAKNYKAWKELSLYRNRMKNYADTTGISGYAVASLVSGEKYSSKDPVLTGLSERHKRTVTNTVNKIRAAKEFKKGYVSHSEALRKGSKQSFLNKTREDVELENTSDEFKRIVTVFSEYANMDITSQMGYYQKEYSVSYSSARIGEEARCLSGALALAQARLNELQSNKAKERQPGSKVDYELEIERLTWYVAEAGKFMNGTLEIPQEAKIIQVGDEAFVDGDIDLEHSILKDEHAHTMRDRTKEPLFAHEPSVNDIVQGHVGDCYALSAIAAVVEEDPATIKRCMKDNGDTVTVRFYSGKDHPIYVTVKKTVPRRVNSNNEEKDIFARGALWVQMLEKAYVASGLAMQMKKWTGPDASMKSRDEDEFSTIALALQKQGKVHYETIGGGDSSSFMFFLTGKKGKHGNFVTSYSSPNKQFEKGVYDIPADDHSFWNMVLNKEQGKGKVITVSTKSDYMMVDEEKGLNNEKMFRGLATNHSYTVLGIERIDGEERILLRNPWGTGTAEEVYNEVTGSIGIRKSEDPTDGGVFTLSKVQFFSMFDGYHIGRIPGEGIKKGSGK